MKKILVKYLCVAVVLLMLIPLTACKKDNETASNRDPANTVNAAPETTKPTTDAPIDSTTNGTAQNPTEKETEKDKPENEEKPAKKDTGTDSKDNKDRVFSDDYQEIFENLKEFYAYCEKDHPSYSIDPKALLPFEKLFPGFECRNISIDKNNTYSYDLKRKSGKDNSGLGINIRYDDSQKGKKINEVMDYSAAKNKSYTELKSMSFKDNGDVFLTNVGNDPVAYSTVTGEGIYACQFVIDGFVLTVTGICDFTPADAEYDYVQSWVTSADKRIAEFKEVIKAIS